MAEETRRVFLPPSRGIVPLGHFGMQRLFFVQLYEVCACTRKLIDKLCFVCYVRAHAR